MKLRHTLAGTVALPLALAVASANAATVFDDERGKLEMNGYISGIFSETIYDDAKPHDSDVNNGIGLGLSRLGFKYTNEAGVTLLYENDWNSSNGNPGQAAYRLRHAAVMYNGLVAGQTWSGFANLTGLGETIDAAGTSGSAAWANRTAVLGYSHSLNDDMSVGIFLEDQNIGSAPKGRSAHTAVPDVTANFKGSFGDVEVFVGARMLQVDDGKSLVYTDEENDLYNLTYADMLAKLEDLGEDEDDLKEAIEHGFITSQGTETEAKIDFTLGAKYNLDALTLQFAATAYEQDSVADDIAVSLAAGYAISEQFRMNLVAEQYMADAKDSDRTTIWLNGFYTLDSGLELGGELQFVSADDNADKISGLGDSDMALRIQAKYAF